MVTLKQIADKAGVSVSAVSRTFSAGKSVGKAKREKILAAAKALGDTRIPADIPTPDSIRLVLQLDEDTLRAFPSIWTILHALAQQHKIEWLMSPQTPSPANLGLLRIGGLPTHAPPEHTHRLATVHCLPTQFPESGAAVGVDYRRTGEQAAQILLAAGYTNFAFLGAGRDHTITQECYVGFSAVLDRAVQLDWAQYHTQANTVFAAKQELMQHMANKNLSRAYFCCTADLALGASIALLQGGVTVPEQTALLGLGHPLGIDSDFALSTLQPPLEDILRSGVSHLLKLIAEPRTSKEQRILPCRLVDQGSLNIV